MDFKPIPFVIIDPAETYTLAASETGVIRGSDGAFIPADPANTDWRAFEAWKAAGGVPAAYVPPPAPPVVDTITWMDFVALFTPSELAGIAVSVNPAVAVFRLMATGLGGDMNLADPKVAAGLDALVAAGLIAEARKAQILARETPAM